MRNQTVRRLLLVLVATAPLTSCQYLSAGEDIEIIDPIATTIEAQERATETAQDITDAINGGADETFEEPVVATPTVTADLIQSTDPSARAQAVARSRSDPFASLPIPLAPEPIEPPEAATRASSNGGASTGSTSGSTSASPTKPTPSAVRVRETPPPVPPIIAEVPAIPQPVIAPAVSVSGIVQLGGTPYAIVRSSSEPERYVKVGDRIGNGSVRVKRIETLAYEPRVIFEENGIEVAKSVSGSAEPIGEASPTEEAAETEPVTALPTTAISSVAALPAPLQTPLSPVPTDATGQAATFLPGLSLPPAPRTNLLQPAPGYIPNSLMLLPPDEELQTRLPNELKATRMTA